MSPVGQGELSLTKFYRLRQLVNELARVRPGMSEGQVRGLLGPGHQELADDLVLYADGRVVGDPLLAACRSGGAHALVLILVALVMADHRLARVVEDVLSDATGKLIPDEFNTDRLEASLQQVLGTTATRKAATNILSYYRDSGLVVPITEGNTTVGISRTVSATPAVPEVIDYVNVRLAHFGLTPKAGDRVGVALAVRANAWINLTAQEFRQATARSQPPAVAAVVTTVPVTRTAAHPISTPAAAPAVGLAAETTVNEVEVEAHNTERFTVSAQERREAKRREQPLVRAYKAWMETKGSVVVRLLIRPKGTAVKLYCDVFDRTRNNLIEAKGDTTRVATRMAIGELADYARFANPPAARALLTPHRPAEDLEALLKSLGIACIWLEGDVFCDNAEGRFV